MHLPAWLDFKVLLTICSLALSAFVFLFGRWILKKDLRWETEVTNIKGFDNDFSGKLRMTFEGKAVRDISAVKIIIRNAGRKTIEPKDYERPLEVKVACGELFWAGKAEANRKFIEPHLTVDFESSCLTVSPLLLNAGDEIRFPFLASEYRDVVVEGRISDVKEIKRSRLASQSLASVYSLGLVSGLAAAAVFASLLLSFIPMATPLAIILMTTLIVIWKSVTNYREKKR